jgi:hypothetical protein
MRHLHFVLIALPIRALLDISFFIATYLEQRKEQHKKWWYGQGDAMGNWKR